MSMGSSSQSWSPHGFLALVLSVVQLFVLISSIPNSVTASVSAAGQGWTTRYPHANTWYVNNNASIGADTLTCGGIATPCQSIGFALGLLLGQSSSTIQTTCGNNVNISCGAIAVAAGTIPISILNIGLDFGISSVRLYAYQGDGTVTIDGLSTFSPVPFIHIDTTTLGLTWNTTSDGTLLPTGLQSSIEGFRFINGVSMQGGAVVIKGNGVNLGQTISFSNCYWADNKVEYRFYPPPAAPIYAYPPQAGAVYLEGVTMPTSASAVAVNPLFQSPMGGTGAGHTPIFTDTTTPSRSGVAAFMNVVGVSFVDCFFERNTYNIPAAPYNISPDPPAYSMFGSLGVNGGYVYIHRTTFFNHTDVNAAYPVMLMGSGATLFHESTISVCADFAMGINFLDSFTFAKVPILHHFVAMDSVFTEIGLQVPIGWGAIGWGSAATINFINTTFSHIYAPLLYNFNSAGKIAFYDSILTNNQIVAPQFFQIFAAPTPQTFPPWLFVRTIFSNNAIGVLTGIGNGAVWGSVENVQPMQFEDCQFQSNLAVNLGGVFNLDSAPAGANLYITGCTFTDSFASKGGVLYITASTALVTILNSTFVSNNALNEGGALWIGSGDVLVRGCSFQSNTGQRGGAIAIAAGNSGTQFILTDSSFLSNSADQGGAIYAYPGSTAALSYTNFILNRASSGGAVYDNAPLSYVNSTFLNNHATGRGGAIYIPPTLTPLVPLPYLITLAQLVTRATQVTQCGFGSLGAFSTPYSWINFTRNSAGLIGGAIALDDSHPSCVNFCGTPPTDPVTVNAFENAQLSSATSPFRMDFCSFEGNSAGRGYGSGFSFGPNALSLVKLSTVGLIQVSSNVTTLSQDISGLSSLVIYPGLPFSLTFAAVDAIGRVYTTTGGGADGLAVLLALNTSSALSVSLDAASAAAMSITIADGIFEYNNLIIYGAPTGQSVTFTAIPDNTAVPVFSFSLVLESCPVGYYLNPTSTLPTCILTPTTYVMPEGVRSAVWASSAIALAGVSAATVMVVAGWNSSTIRASSRSFLLLLLGFLCALALGSLTYGAIPADVDSSHAQFICTIRGWLSAFPLTGIIAVLICKNQRVSAIFNAKKLVVSKQSTWSLLAIVGGIQLVTLILLIIWSVIPLSKPESVLGSGSLNSQYVIGCSQESGFIAWMSVMISWVGLLMIVAGILAFQTRNLPSQFNESSHLSFALMLLMFFGLIIVPLAFFVEDNPSGLVVVQGVGSALLALLLVVTIFVPKAWFLLTKRADGQRGIADDRSKLDATVVGVSGSGHNITTATGLRITTKGVGGFSGKYVTNGSGGGSSPGPVIRQSTQRMLGGTTATIGVVNSRVGVRSSFESPPLSAAAPEASASSRLPITPTAGPVAVLNNHRPDVTHIFSVNVGTTDLVIDQSLSPTQVLPMTPPQESTDLPNTVPNSE